MGGKKTKIDFQIKHFFLAKSVDLKNPQNTGKVAEMPELLRIDGTIRHADSDKTISKPFLLHCSLIACGLVRIPELAYA